ncbi:WbqC family protein [Lignipirellula cremea]|uniref:WbqC-like protein family protein n=1 Tax=Lignipirellula cremea TaxID=2528010 RepID=A0A518DL29_9BACT|nr:WbqC family protein [Lignipirellula cremea]QDU92543.1 WbqC-like protein family protein [Lignipirellula cremea]
MKLGIMQPYFFPYLGYFDLIDRVDRWVVFDTAQYIRHGWVNRNRILHPRSGWQYLVVPLQKHSRNTPIDQIVVKEDAWRERILGQLNHYRKRAPYFRQTMDLVEECLALRDPHLAALNVHALQCVCRRLGIAFEPMIFSQMELPLAEVKGPGDWALRISEALGASEYLNPPGGQDLFDASRFKAAGIRLVIQSFSPIAYECPGYTLEPGLSVLNALMWLSPEDLMARIRSQRANQDSADTP